MTPSADKESPLRRETPSAEPESPVHPAPWVPPSVGPDARAAQKPADHEDDAGPRIKALADASAIRALTFDLGSPHRCLSSAVLGGGLGWMRAWLNLQVRIGYARMDPDDHLHAVADALRLPQPVVGMLTAADVTAWTSARRGAAHVIATVGIGHPLAAAGARPRLLPRPGTINLLVRLEAPLSDAALVGAVQTAVEAKAQALAEAGIRAANHAGPATGTATDCVCIAVPPGGSVPFAGPATRVGADLAHAVRQAVLAGAQFRGPPST
jgi:adenosylcobinamide hydrolase